jgi:hypothetical protein
MQRARAAGSLMGHQVSFAHCQVAAEASASAAMSSKRFPSGIPEIDRVRRETVSGPPPRRTIDNRDSVLAKQFRRAFDATGPSEANISPVDGRADGDQLHTVAGPGLTPPVPGRKRDVPSVWASPSIISSPRRDRPLRVPCAFRMAGRIIHAGMSDRANETAPIEPAKK